MKKLNLAMAISLLAAAGSTHAATIYEGKGIKYTVKGDIQVQLLQDAGDNEDLDVNYDDAELKNNITYDVGNGTKAFAQVDYDFKKESTEETYVGLDFGGFKFWVGETDYVTDNFEVEKNIDVVDIDGDSFSQDESEDLIAVEFSVGPATIAMSYDLEVGDDEETSFDIYSEIPAGPVEIMLAYQAYELATISTDTFGIGGTAKLGGVKFGLSYTSTDSDTDTDDKDNISAVVSFLLAKTLSGTLGYDIQDFDADSVEDIDTWYANVVYKFPAAKNVSVFAELANTDEDDSDVGYLFGMRVKF
ncbi:MAG: porin [Cellvibrionaceae bacterium]